MDQSKNVKSNPQKERRRFSAQERARHVEQWERSGRSATEYAMENAVEARHLYAWRRKRDKRAPQHQNNASAFIPVRLTTAPVSAEGVSLTLRHNGLELVVSGIKNIDTLASAGRLLRKEVLSV